MRQSILLTAVLGTLSFAQVSYAAEEEAKSPWAATANVGFVSDYYARGISQNWHKPAAQGGIDITHDSGFYVGMWGSNVTPNTFPDASVEVDVYGGFNGEIPAVEGLGYSVGLIGYLYPGGSWKKYVINNVNQTPSGGRWDTYEANVGLSYKWVSAKASMTIGDWFGAERKTGWDGGTSGTTYIELNAAYPLPWWDLTLVGHVGHLNVAGKLDLTQASSANTANEDNPDYTDYKVGLSKNFKIGASDGWTAGVYYVGASDTGYWSTRGFGGASFNNGTEVKDLAQNKWVLTLGRTF